MEFRHIQRALAGGHDIEAGGPGPIHQFANQRRLVAISHGIDDSSLFGLFRQQRPDQDIGFDVDHDDMAAALDAGQGMADAGLGDARGFDHHIETACVDQQVGVIGQEGRPGGQRLGRRGGVDPLLGPAGGQQGGPRPVDGQVGDAENMQPRGMQRLGQEHGAELSGADQGDADRQVFLGPR